MTNTWRDYRGFKITTNKTYEDMRYRSRKRTAKAVVIGHYFYVWQPCKNRDRFQMVLDLPVVDYPTESEAVIKAQEAIDEILNSEN